MSNQFDHIFVVSVAFDCSRLIAFSALVVVMSHARMYHRIYPQICCILFIPSSSRRGDLLGAGGAAVVCVNFVGGAGCGESCGLFGVGMAKSCQNFINISCEGEFYPLFSLIIPFEGNTSEACSAPIHFHYVPL